MNKSNFTSKFLFVTWLVFIILFALLIAFTAGAAISRHIFQGGNKVPIIIQPAIEKLAQLPGLIKQSTEELFSEISGEPKILLIPKDKSTKTLLAHQFPAPSDDGYILLSGLSGEDKQSVVQLISISDGQILAKWIPDWNYIDNNTTGHRFRPKGSLRAYRAIHPLLLGDGSLIFNTGKSLVRLPLCSSTPLWILDYPYHHSIEFSPRGDSVWVPSMTEVFAVENSFLQKQLIDDSLAEISLDGKVLQNLSFSKILADNNMTAHMLGGGATLDPLHINQITPATSNSRYWQRGDLLISARHTNTVYLYRPNTGKIIWYQQGPWLTQHSAHFFSNHAIVVFGNDVYDWNSPMPFVYKENHNQIYLFDFTSNLTNKLHAESLNKIKPTTTTQGRVKFLEDRSLFIEETNNGRLLKINSSGSLVWSYINTYSKDYLGNLAWSRYLTNKELHSVVNINNLKCK